MTCVVVLTMTNFIIHPHLLIGKEWQIVHKAPLRRRRKFFMALHLYPYGHTGNNDTEHYKYPSFMKMDNKRIIKKFKPYKDLRFEAHPDYLVLGDIETKIPDLSDDHLRSFLYGARIFTDNENTTEHLDSMTRDEMMELMNQYGFSTEKETSLIFG